MPESASSANVTWKCGRRPPVTSASNEPERGNTIPGGAHELEGVELPQRIVEVVSVRAVVGDDLELEPPGVAAARERGEHARDVVDPVAGQDPVDPAARRQTAVVDVHRDDPPGELLEPGENVGLLSDVPEIDAEADRLAAAELEEQGCFGQVDREGEERAE